jgi:hypothetical protein
LWRCARQSPIQNTRGAISRGILLVLATVTDHLSSSRET